MKTFTIKPVFDSSESKRIIGWQLTQYRKVLHSINSIYDEKDSIFAVSDLKNKAIDLGASHTHHWLTGNTEKA